jgi:GNAT superfamily N-acetyltransferase
MDGSNIDWREMGAQVMKIRHACRFEIEKATLEWRRPWLASVRRQLLGLADDPNSRVVVVEEAGQIRAALGLRMRSSGMERVPEAWIVVLVVDPDHEDRGIGSRLIRFAEGIARIRGVRRVDVAPALEEWSKGRCWSLLGYACPESILSKELESPGGWVRE